MRRILIVLCLLLVPLPAFAWSEEGHRLVGELAERALTPAGDAGQDRMASHSCTR